jgi:hypothetical protein
MYTINGTTFRTPPCTLGQFLFLYTVTCQDNGLLEFCVQLYVKPAGQILNFSRETKRRTYIQISQQTTTERRRSSMVWECILL